MLPCERSTRLNKLHTYAHYVVVVVLCVWHVGGALAVIVQNSFVAVLRTNGVDLRVPSFCFFCRIRGFVDHSSPLVCSSFAHMYRLFVEQLEG